MSQAYDALNGEYLNEFSVMSENILGCESVVYGEMLDEKNQCSKISLSLKIQSQGVRLRKKSHYFCRLHRNSPGEYKIDPYVGRHGSLLFFGSW